MLIVSNTNLKGRGIFAQKHFLRGEIVERSPVVVIPAEQVEFLDKTILGNYYYDWEDKAAAIALGLASLFNHSYEPNTYYVKKFAEGEVELIAYRDIEAGEEITANYNGSPNDKSPIWFDVVNEISSLRN
ncbi:SET domain-containing protein-lysine N-methyltransferase [Nostoc sp. 'Peltigera membranacea cyanobiont' 213]|uniref:SET domain-containing protein n=1 Tax=unclassified Nostoc TaxID=2593658 RepID=UPI000B952CD7|nr:MULTISPECIES: SET domain-containing protein [unclassified Nostoc]AVH63268.1 SET domain protein [Nostoc sp. 'Peltigera membranacea cyanobiont' N6]OYD89599.1 SET domain-containing protein-lysine N-methyltransferase [Nostoc sp. 'Peltigera membranacea cyanobiont' 213]